METDEQSPSNIVIPVSQPTVSVHDRPADQRVNEYSSIRIELSSNTIRDINQLLSQRQNLALRTSLSSVQGASCLAAFIAFLWSAFETSKALIAVAFAVNFVSLILFSLRIDLMPIAPIIMPSIVFFILGIVAAANDSGFGLHLALFWLVVLVCTVTIFYVGKRYSSQSNDVESHLILQPVTERPEQVSA